MVMVVAVMGAIYGFGVVFDAPKRVRWIGIGVVYVLVVGLHLALPDGNGLREATGKTADPWVIVGVLIGLGFGYRALLSALKGRSKVEEASHEPAMDGELERNARHIVLREIGGPGQKRIKQARVLVVGAGGLGAPALQYLAGAGVGVIGVIDDDVVDNSNLSRQIIHRNEDIGTPKVFSAKRAMCAQNPYVEVRPYHRRLTEDIAAGLFADYDLILDGTDNFETRYLVNRAAVKAGKPLISGALSQWEGQISCFDPTNGAPCYQCVFPKAPADGLAPSCAQAGVLAPLPGVIGTMMAVEAIKLIVQAGEVLRGRMLIYDALYAETRIIGLDRRADCSVCSDIAPPSASR